MGQSLLTSSSPELPVIAKVAARALGSTKAANNRLIADATSPDAATATSQQVRWGLQSRAEAMTDAEKAMAYQLTHLLEDRARLEQQDMDTRLISLQIIQLCQN